MTAFDINSQQREALCDLGGKACKEIKDIAPNQDVLITMLPSGQQLLEIYAEHGPLLNHLKPSCLLIDCSTVGTIAAQHWHGIVNKKGYRSVDAPVSGGVVAAKNQSLTFMMGGSSNDISDAQQILSHIGKQFIHTGHKSSGQTAKICNNLILANNMIALSEAFILAKKLGLQQEKFLEVVQKSSGNSWVVEKYLPIANLMENVPANNHYQPGFSTQMMAKDLNLVKECCEQLNLELKVTHTSQTLYDDMLKDKLGDKDFSYVYAYIQAINDQD